MRQHHDGWPLTRPYEHGPVALIPLLVISPQDGSSLYEGLHLLRSHLGFSARLAAALRGNTCQRSCCPQSSACPKRASTDIRRPCTLNRPWADAGRACHEHTDGIQPPFRLDGRTASTPEFNEPLQPLHRPGHGLTGRYGHGHGRLRQLGSH